MAGIDILLSAVSANRTNPPYYSALTDFKPFDKRDSTKNLCFYEEFGIEWFQWKVPQRLTDARESATIKEQKGILPVDGHPRFRLLQKSNRVLWLGRLLF